MDALIFSILAFLFAAVLPNLGKKGGKRDPGSLNKNERDGSQRPSARVVPVHRTNVQGGHHEWPDAGDMAGAKAKGHSAGAVKQPAQGEETPGLKTAQKLDQQRGPGPLVPVEEIGSELAAEEPGGTADDYRGVSSWPFFDQHQLTWAIVMMEVLGPPPGRKWKAPRRW